MPASLRAPDLIEDNPDTSLPRAVRLHNLIRFQLRGNDTVSLLHWISAPASGAPGEVSPGYWAAWLDRPAPKEDPLRQAGVTVPSEAAIAAG